MTSLIRIVPLGGLGEVGKNMMAIEHGDDIVVIDAGVMFPKQDMHGVDLVLPDTTYLVERRDRVRAILITHGHEDHTGALPYVLRDLHVPVYAPPLAHDLINVKLSEHSGVGHYDLREVNPGDRIELGSIEAEYFRVCHSIPDACGIALHTPSGLVVHSGDFKIDHTPVDGKPTELQRLAELGREGVLLLLSDSTYLRGGAGAYAVGAGGERGARSCVGRCAGAGAGRHVRIVDRAGSADLGRRRQAWSQGGARRSQHGEQRQHGGREGLYPRPTGNDRRSADVGEPPAGAAGDCADRSAG